MANSGKGSSGKGMARSLGAAKAGGNPNGAILDDTTEILAMRSQRFKAWAKGHREKGLKENPWTSMYKTTPNSIKAGQ